MVDAEVISRRLEKLREYIGYLKELRNKPEQVFITDPFIYGNAERYLQLAIQSMLDIGNHLIADQAEGRPEEYRDIFEIMGKAGILSQEFAAKLQPLAGLRNILVHDYLEVDRKKIYHLLQEHLKDFEEYSRAIVDDIT